MAYTRSLLLLALAAGTFAGPVNFNEFESSTKCARSCPDSSKFGYETGKTYVYSYEADLKTTVPGAASEHSSLHVQATAKVEVLSKCEMNLKLTNVELKDSSPSDFSDRSNVAASRQFRDALQDKALRFGFMDGKVDDVCPDEEEETWVLNIKRGILSGLQNTMPDLAINTKARESDVSGDCEVEYNVVKAGYRVSKVNKIKDMLGCVGRHNYNGFFQGIPYEVPSRMQSLPLLKSSQECEQEVNSGKVLLQTICKEMHTFRPFSNGNNGATTEVTSKLALTGEDNGVSGSERRIPRRESILFDHKPSKDSSTAGRQEAMDTLREMCRLTTTDIRPAVPGLFNKLVHQLRRLDVTNLKAVHTSAEGLCSKAHNFVHDAVPTLHSRASVALITELLTSGEVSEAEADLWLTSIAFISHPCKGVLMDAKPLMDLNPPNKKAVLAVGSLVYTFCTQHENCQNEPTVKQILSSMESNLRYNCKANNDKQHEQVLMNLKAIGNSGFAETIVPTLNKCFMETDNPMEIRLAAITAFRRMTCTSNNDQLIRMMENTEADPELRIGAYLALMQCPSREVISKCRDILLKEEINQVGSFMWTHLTNLMESSSPHKQQIRLIMENITLMKSFDLDKRKFSRNIEWSMFSEMLNSGAMLESNLVWSHKSFVPRSASVNLTVDIFGQSVNLMELGGRVEGFESMLEKIFAGKDFDSLFEPNEKKELKKAEVQNFDNTFKEDPVEPSGSFYVRMFGNEIRYCDFHGLELPALQDKFNYLQFLMDLAKEHNIEFTKNIPLVDSEVTVPTGVGLPLTLSVEGSAVVDLKLKGKLDLRSAAVAPRSIDINGSIRPSAAIEFSGHMGVDATVASTGLKLVTTLHSSTVADGKIELKDGKIFNMDINMPDEKMEILSAETKFFVTHRDTDREQDMITDNRLTKSRCTGAWGAKIIGMELCGEVAFPRAFHVVDAPWFPFSGPASAKVTLYKRDTYRGFHFETKFMQEKVRGHIVGDQAKVSFSTPGGSLDREFTADFKLNRGDMTTSLYVKTPWTKANIDGSVIYTDETKRLTLTAKIDDKRDYRTMVELLTQIGSMTKYTPKVEVALHGKTPYKFGGTVIYRAGKRAEVDLTLKNVFDQPLTVKGDMRVIKNNRFQTNLTVDSPVFEGRIGGFLQKPDNVNDPYSSKLDVVYQLTGKSQQKMSLSNKWKFVTSKAGTEFELDSSVSTTKWSQYNSDIKLEYSHDASSVTFSGDAGLSDRREKRVKASMNANNKSTRKNWAYSGLMKLEVPYKAINYEMNFDHSHNMDSLKSAAGVKYAPNKEIKMNADMSKSLGPLKASADLKLSIPGREFGFIETLEERKPKEYYHDLTVKLDKYDDIKITSEYKMQPRHEFTADITIPFVKKIHVQTHVNPDLKKFQSHAKVVYGRDSYSVDADWTHNPGKNMATEGKFDVVYPSRHITLEGEVNSKGRTYSANVNTKWDADNDAAKKFIASGEVTVSEAKPSFQLKTQWWPNQYMELSGNLKNDKNGWWHPTRDLEGELNLKTSFDSVKDVGFSFKHDQSEEETHTHGEVSWARGQKLDADFKLKLLNGWKNIESAFEVNTPFDIKTAHYELEYNYNGNSLTGSTKTMWNDKQMALTVNGNTDMRTNFQGTTTFTSPFQNFNRLSMTVNHNQADKIKTEVEVSWDKNQEMKAILNMDNSLRGWYLTTNGDLSLTTPFQNYRNNKLTWSHQNDGGEIKCNAELAMDRAKTEFELEGKMKASRSKRSLSLKSSFKSPYEPVKDLGLEFSHEHEPNAWNNIKTSGNVQWARGQVIKVDQDFGLQSTSVEGNLKFTSPFDGFELMSVNLVGGKNNEEYTFHKEIKFSGNKKITLDGSWTGSGPIYDGELRFTSPFKPVERLVLTASNQNVKKVWSNNIAFEYKPDHKIEIQGKFGMGKRNVVGIDIKTPCSSFQSLVIDLENSGDIRDFEVKGEFSLVPTLDNKMEVVAKMDTQSLDDIKGQVSLATPFEEYSNFKAAVSHKKSGGQRYISSLSLECPHHKVTLMHNVNLDLTDFTCHSEVEYMTGKKIELDIAFKPSPKVTGSLSLKAPFDEFKELTTSFTHEGSLMDFKTGGEILYQPGNKRLTGNVDFEGTRNSAKGGVHLTTPFQGYNIMNANFDHQGVWKNFKSDASATVGRTRITGATEFKLQGTTLELESSITTPFSPVQTMNLKVNHNGPANSFTNNAEIGYANKKYTFGTNFELADQKVKGGAKITTPHSDYDTMSVNFNHEGSLKNFKCDGAIVFGSTTMNGETAFKLQGTTLELSATLVTPFNPVQTITLNVNHNGGLSEFTNSAELTYGNNKKMSIGSEYETTKKGFNGKIIVKSPYSQLHNLVINLDHAGRWKQFKNSATINYNGQKIAGNTNFKMNGKTVKGSATFKQGSTSYTITVLHKGTRFNFDNSVKINFAGDKYSANSEFEWKGQAISGSAELSIPAKYQLSFTHNGDWKEFTNNAQLKLKKEIYEASSEFKMENDGQKIHFDTKVKTPTAAEYGFAFDREFKSTRHGTYTFVQKSVLTVDEAKYIKEFSITSQSYQPTVSLLAKGPNHEFNLNYENGNINIIANGNDVKYAVTSEFKRQGTTVQGSGSITENSRELYGFSVSHTGNKYNFDNNGEVRIGQETYKASSEFEKQGRTFSGSVKFNVPEAYTLSFTHSGSITDFRNNAEAMIRGQKYSGSSEFKYVERRSISAKATVNTPDEYTLEFNRERTTTGATNNAEFNMAGKKFTASNTYSLQGGNVQVSGTVTSPYQPYTKFGFNIDHQMRSSNDFETTGKVTTSMRGYEEFTANVKHGYQGGNLATSFNVDTPMSGYQNMGAEVKYEGRPDNFRSSLLVKTPFLRMKRHTLTVNHQGHLSDFTSKVTMECGNKKMEGEAKFKKTGTWLEDDHEGSLKITTPYDMIKDAEFMVNNQRTSGRWDGTVQATYNGAKHLDADYNFGVGDVKSVQFNIRQPQPLAATASLDSRSGINGDANVDWDSNNYGLNFGLKNEDTEKELIVKAKLPFRTIGLTTGYELANGRFAHKSEVQWDDHVDRKFSYEIEGSKTMRSSRHISDGRINIKSRHVNFDGSFNMKCTPGRRHEAEIKLQDFTLKSDLTTREPGLRDFQTSFTVKHPSLSKDLELSIEGIAKPELPHFEGKMTTSFANEKMEFMGKIADDSANHDGEHYVVEARLTHPGSDFDAHFTSEAYNNNKKVGGAAEVTYLMRNRKSVVTNVRTEINKIRKELILQTANPLLPTQLTASIASTGSSEHRFKLDGSVGKHPVRGSVLITKDNPGFDVTFYYTADDLLRVYAKMLNPSTAEFKAYREENGVEIPELVLAVRLNTSRLVHGRAHMRPDLFRDMKSLADREYGWDAHLDQLNREAVEELKAKKDGLNRATEPLQEIVGDVTDNLETVHKRLAKAYAYMYNKNEFYIKDISNKMGEWNEIVSEYCERRMIDMKHYWENFCREQQEKYEQLKADWEQFKEEARMQYQIISERAKRFATEALEKIEECKRQLREAYPLMAQKYDESIENMYNSYNGLVDNIQNHPTMKVMMNTMHSIQMPFKDWQATLKHQSGWLADAYGEMKVIVKDNWMELKNRPEMAHVDYAWVDYAIVQSQWAYDYYKIEENVLDFLRDIRDNGLDNVKANIAKKISDYFQFEKTKVTVWEPTQGEYQAELYLPFPMNDLKTIPQGLFHVRRYIIQTRNTIKNYFPKNEPNKWNIWDTFYRYKPTGDFYSWIPPFEGHAAISGAQHYMTFDKSFFEFSGECSYLLARDFIDGKFSVVVNYDTIRGMMTKKSISVYIGDKHVEILPEFKILVDGKQTDMPYIYETTTIRRMGSSIRVDNEHGLTVTCDLPHDHCTLNVSGWYYGKTGGLLGTYDNEPSTDFINSERAKVSSVERFASSWTVGRRCTPTNNARMVTPDPTSRTYKTCAKYFESEYSPFRLCFKQVDHKEFMKMCVNDLITRPNSIEAENDVCNTASFYVAECTRHGIPIRMPKSCVSCQAPSKRMFYEGESITIKKEDGQIPTSADVVLVVAHQKCNTDVIDKLNDVVSLTDKALKTEGLTDTRFGLVGYGGEGMTAMPHSYTMEGALFNSRHKFAPSLDKFMAEETSNADTLAAIRFAAKYPFRAGVSKTIIVVPCEKCTEKAVSYGEIQKLLLDRDITMHVLMQHDFKLVKGDSVKTSYIFGADRKTVFTQKHVGDRELKGDRDLRKQISTPKDLCVALTEETDGSVWNSLKLTEGKPLAQKKFVDVMSRLYAKKATPTECQICDCQPEEETGMGMAVCRDCNKRNPIYNVFPDLYFGFGEDDDVALPDISSEKPKVKKTRMNKNKKFKNKRPRNSRPYRNRNRNPEA
jgi:hypothetical protein